ncbi:hypothetical protein C5L14_11130 [Labrys okinawensis]|uniref:Uncharacterized protein n=1 Tax=Labrys okinawensis TaxID=346911 RepID=A0A2S9QCW6_9HYPH|nr:hypothetical protein [Labrys okinawensis]PRH87187.1 hypothetical protein C5L14_11130 [Labrys okinawensis]
MEARERIGLAALGTIGLVLSIGGFVLHSPARQSAAAEAAMAGREAADPRPIAVASPAGQAPAAVPPAQPTPYAACLRKGIGVTLGKTALRVPGPPALTLVTGEKADEEINFSTKAGLEKACSQPEVTAKALVLTLEAMDKPFGAAAGWRAEFCKEGGDRAMLFLCSGEERQAGAPRSLVTVALYEPVSFQGDSLFQAKAPDLDNFKAWKDRLTKAGTPPPAQPDGDYDIYPGGIWLERDAKSAAPFLVSCDVDGLPVTGQHYCVGTLGLQEGLRARLEFRTMTPEIGREAAAAAANFKALLAAWQAAASQSAPVSSQPGK